MIYCLITFDSQLNTALKGVATNIPSSAYVYTVTSNNLFHLGKEILGHSRFHYGDISLMAIQLQ